MQLFRKLSVWYIVAIPLCAGISTLDVKIGGMNYTGYLWLALLVVGLYLLVMNRLLVVDPGGIFPAAPWLVWCGFAWLSLFWAGFDRRNIQEAMQLSTPLLTGLVAASAIRTRADLRLLFAAFSVALGLFILFTLAYVTHTFDREWMNTQVRATALSAALAGCVFLALFPQRKAVAIGGWATCLAIAALTSSRIATLALLAVPMLHPYFRGRWLWKAAAVGAFVTIGLAIFHTDSFQKRFFESGHGTISDLFSGEIDDMGRFTAWTEMWYEAWRHPVLGAGFGAAYDFVPEFWEDMNYIHNDYLRIFYELGIVGLMLFVAVCVWQLFALRRRIAATDGIVRATFAAASLGLCAMLISCATDNTIIYNVLYMNPLFALLGAAYGADFGLRISGCGAKNTAKPQAVAVSVSMPTACGLAPRSHPQSAIAVSVIVPTYNRADFVADAINSALDQTRAPHEIIVIDDGSTDQTAELLARYGPPVRVIRQPNRGRSAARNAGLRAATGDAVLLLDSDDLLMPACIERCAQVLEQRPEIDVVYTDAHMCDKAGQRLGRHSQHLPGTRPSGNILSELARRNFLTITSLVRRSSLGDAAFDERLECAEDYDFWRQLARRCRFHYLGDPLLCYRFHEAMTVSSRLHEALAAEVEVQRRIIEMPEFARISRRGRARIFCSHGIKQAMLGRTAAARAQFCRAIRTSPLHPGGYALLSLSLLGDRALVHAIHKRRQLAGNKLGTRTDHRLLTLTLTNRLPATRWGRG